MEKTGTMFLEFNFILLNAGQDREEAENDHFI